jgi:ketosteroid isomerase-like protein
MSEENVEIVRRSIEAWDRRDLRALMTPYRSDAEVDWSRSEGPFKGVYRGHDGIQTFWDLLWSMFEEGHLETHDFRQVGSDVVVPNTARFRGREGIEVSARTVLVFTLERGQITRLRLFPNLNEALEAAGLRG